MEWMYIVIAVFVAFIVWGEWAHNQAAKAEYKEIAYPDCPDCGGEGWEWCLPMAPGGCTSLGRCYSCAQREADEIYGTPHD